MKTKSLVATAVCAVAAFLSPEESSADQQNVQITPIYGFGGTPSAGWVADTNTNIKLGLRAIDPSSGATTNDGAGTYTFTLGTSVNIDFSMNVDALGMGGSDLLDYAFVFSYDSDPTAGVVWNSFNPLSLITNSYGNTTTGNGAGVEDNNPGLHTVGQNSLSSFLVGSPSVAGDYSQRLTASLNGSPLVTVDMNLRFVEAVPEPSTWILVVASAAGFGCFVAARRKKLPR